MDLKLAVGTFVRRIVANGIEEGVLSDSPALRQLLKREIELVLIRGAIIQQGRSPEEYEAMLLRTFGPNWAELDVPVTTDAELIV